MAAAPLRRLAVFADADHDLACRTGTCAAGSTRLVGAGTPLKTRPARSNFDWWHGQKKPPSQSGPRSAGATSGRNVGEQPRCVQMPTATHIASLIERCSFLQYAGCCGTFGIRIGEPARRASAASRASACVRLMIQHDLAAPLDVDLLARLDLADVDFDRRAGRLRALAREERHHERRRRRHAADAADDARRADQEAALALVDCCCPRPLLPPCRPARLSSGVAASAGTEQAPVRKPVDYKGFARRAGRRTVIRDPENRSGISELHVASCGMTRYPSGHERPIGAARRCRAAATDYNRRLCRYGSTIRRAPQILAPLRAGLHAVPRRAVRRRDAAAGPAAARRRGTRGQRRAAAGDVDAGGRRRRSRRYADAAKKAMPAVVNIYTSKEMRAAQSARRRPAAAPLLSRPRRAAAAPARRRASAPA